MVSTESLVALGEALGNAGFKVATQQYVAAHHLLLRLAAEGALPASPRELAPLLGPIFCTSAAEQRLFPEVYETWLRARSAGAAPAPPPRTPIPRRRRLGWQVALVALLMVVSVLVAFAWFISRPGPSAPSASDPVPGPSPTATPTEPRGRVPVAAPATVPPGSPLLERLEPLTTLDARWVVPEPRRWERVLWRNVALVALPLLVFAVWQIGRATRRPVLRRISSRTPDELREVDLPGGARAVLPGFPLRRLAQELRRRRQVASRELQVEPTVRATLKNGGLFTPVVGSRIEPSHLVLVDRASLHDHQARLADTVLAELLRSDVLMDGCDFDGDARLCRPWQPNALAPASRRRPTALAHAVGPQAVALDELLVRYPDHRVLVFADAAVCFDEFEGSPAGWLARLLESHSPILVTPRPQGAWGQREWALQELGLEVLPLSQAGMLALMAIVAETPRVTGGSPPSDPRRRLHEQSASRWLERNPPAADLVQRLCDGLRDDLGSRGFAWLAACAAYPEIHWGLTLRLGAALVPDARNLEGLLPRLARFVWFRKAYMPDWLREALLDRLEPAEEDLTRAALDALLSGLLETGRDLPLRIAVSAPPRRESWAGPLRRSLVSRRLRAEGLLRAAPVDSPFRDHVFLTFVTGRRRSKLDPLAPTRLLRELRHGAHHLAWMPAGALLLSLLVTTLLASRLQLTRVEVESYQVGDVAMTFLSDGTVLALIAGVYDTPETTEGTLQLVRWQQRDGRWLSRRQALSAPAGVNREARPVAMNSTGTRAAWVQPDGRIGVRDVARNQAVGTPLSAGRAGAPARLALSPDGRWLLAGGDEGVWLWDLADGAQSGRPLLAAGLGLTTIRAPAGTSAFSPDSAHIAIGVDPGVSQLWTVGDPGSSRAPSFVGTVEGSGAAFSPDGQLLATSDGRSIRLWAVEFSPPYNARAASSGARGPAKVRLRIEWAGSLVLGVFSPDNRLFAAIGSDGNAVVWEVRSGRRLGQPVPAGKVSPVVAFNAGSDQLLVGGTDGSTIWHIPPYPVVTIPVVVHVIYATGEQSISDEQIASQIAVLNADFRAKNADLSKVPVAFRDRIGDAAIEFRLADVDPNGQPTRGITRTMTRRQSFAADDSVKYDARGGKNAWPSGQYLNLWVAPLEGGILGYSTFPGGPAELDGVVIHFTVFGTMGTAEPQRNKGRTTTAQVGRYLGVRHIWGDDQACEGTDSVDDTPNQAGPNFGKPTFPHVTCNNGPSGDMFMNFADYTDDDTMVMFTKGQVARMRQTLDGPRSGLLNPRAPRPPAITRRQPPPIQRPSTVIKK